MLHSRDKCAGDNSPVFALCFANFFEPFFSSKKAVRRGLIDIKKQGFNSVILDSKLWKDFSDFFKTGMVMSIQKRAS